jgi:selenocysteine lyase/cysteine desulfurase
MPDTSRRRFFNSLTSLALLTATDLSALTAFATESYRSSSGIDWPRVRADFLFRDGLTYLNCGALGATPKPVLAKTIQYLQELETFPAREAYGDLQTKMEDVRATAARLLGCGLKELVLTSSTSDGMNIIAQGIGLTAGQRVLSTDQEHPGGRACWDYFARRFQIQIDRVKLPLAPRSADEIVSLFAAAITPQTRVISLSHVTFMTGTLMPVREIADLARAHGALCVVDGAQSAGSIAVNVKSLGCDAYATSGHKWLLGPKGTGLLYISEAARKSIDPIFLEDGERAYTESTGVRNIPGILGLGAAVDYVSAIGQEEITKHNLTLRNLAYEGMKRLPKVSVISPPPGPLASALVSLKLPEGVASRDFARMLVSRHNISTRPIGPETIASGLRVSPHLYNNEEDIERFLSAMNKEL